MNVENQHCLAVVTNADASVLRLTLPDGFTFRSRGLDELVPLLAKLEFLAEHEVRARLIGKYRCVTPTQQIHTIEGQVSLPRVEPSASPDEDQILIDAEQAVVRQVGRYVELLQLFKDSSIDLVLFYRFRGSFADPEYTLSQAATNFAELPTEHDVFPLLSKLVIAKATAAPQVE